MSDDFYDCGLVHMVLFIIFLLPSVSPFLHSTTVNGYSFGETTTELWMMLKSVI